MANKLLSRDTDYAVRALCYLAENPGKLVTAEKMAEELGMPRPFLRRILQVLNRHNILASQKGVGGGFRLARPPEEIRLLGLISVFQGPLNLNECLFRKKVCPNRQECPLREKIGRIEKIVATELEAVTIASLLPAGKRANGQKQGEKIG